VSDGRRIIFAFLNIGDNKMANQTSNRGFASMDEDKQREIARNGGKLGAVTTLHTSSMSKLARKVEATTLAKSSTSRLESRATRIGN
jgi:hypothetical protein